MNKRNVISEINKLNKILNKINNRNIDNIKKLHSDFLGKNKYTIENYIINLSNLRKKLKNQILKYEREIMEIDKNIIENKKYNKKCKSKLTEEIYHLHKANDNIKITLKNILLKIK